MEAPTSDTIGGFPEKREDCKGCGAPLTIENAWMADGCSCNSPLGINSMNETRWRLLMRLQQRQSRIIERLMGAITQIEELSYGGKGESAIHVVATSAHTAVIEMEEPNGGGGCDEGRGVMTYTPDEIRAEAERMKAEQREASCLQLSFLACSWKLPDMTLQLLEELRELQSRAAPEAESDPL